MWKSWTWKPTKLTIETKTCSGLQHLGIKIGSLAQHEWIDRPAHLAWKAVTRWQLLFHNITRMPWRLISYHSLFVNFVWISGLSVHKTICVVWRSDCFPWWGPAWAGTKISRAPVFSTRHIQSRTSTAWVWSLDRKREPPPVDHTHLGLGLTNK